MPVSAPSDDDWARIVGSQPSFECPTSSETARPVNATRFRTWVHCEHMNLSSAHAMKNSKFQIPADLCDGKSEIRNSKFEILELN